MTVLIFTAIIFLLYLTYERIILQRRINSIPLRIGITGIRGKTSVTRMLASILRQNGRRVLAKTTGSQAQLILPDGEVIDIRRRGITSIIEQKKLLKKARELHTDCLIAEIMSIQPENHFVESHQLIQPHIIAITNIRQDHIDAMGETKDDIAAVYSLDIPEKAVVFIPEKENKEIFQKVVDRSEGKLIKVRKGVSDSLQKDVPELKINEFADNIDLVYAIAKYFDIDENVILDGLRTIKHDIGAFKIWQYQSEFNEKTNYFVNAFSANDPESTVQIISKLREIFPEISNHLVGLLSLRADRGDRTKQWMKTIKNGYADYFKKIFVVGDHAGIVARKVQCENINRSKTPEKMTQKVLAEIEDQDVIFGFGNMGGTGKQLMAYWKQIGDEYGI